MQMQIEAVDTTANKNKLIHRISVDKKDQSGSKKQKTKAAASPSINKAWMGVEEKEDARITRFRNKQPELMDALCTILDDSLQMSPATQLCVCEMLSDMHSKWSEWVSTNNPTLTDFVTMMKKPRLSVQEVSMFTKIASDCNVTNDDDELDLVLRRFVRTALMVAETQEIASRQTPFILENIKKAFSSRIDYFLADHPSMLLFGDVKSKLLEMCEYYHVLVDKMLPSASAATKTKKTLQLLLLETEKLFELFVAIQSQTTHNQSKEQWIKALTSENMELMSFRGCVVKVTDIVRKMGKKNIHVNESDILQCVESGVFDAMLQTTATTTTKSGKDEIGSSSSWLSMKDLMHQRHIALVTNS
jgi:hypothetical protein